MVDTMAVNWAAQRVAYLVVLMAVWLEMKTAATTEPQKADLKAVQLD